MKIWKPNIINSMCFHNPRLQHRQTGYISVTRQHIQQQYVLVAVTLVLRGGSDANTCKKSLTDGVNEDSDYLFRGGQERGRAERKRDRKNWKITLAKRKNKAKPRQCLKTVHNWVKNQTENVTAWLPSCVSAAFQLLSHARLDLSVSPRLCVPVVFSLSPHYQASLICHHEAHHSTDGTGAIGFSNVLQVCV